MQVSSLLYASVVSLKYLDVTAANEAETLANSLCASLDCPCPRCRYLRDSTLGANVRREVQTFSAEWPWQGFG